jgi:hypothetical protein
MELMFGLASLASGALGFLGKLPIWVWFLAGALVWGWLGHHEAATLRKDWATEREANATETARVEAMHRGEERRREIEKEGVINEINKRLDRARVVGATESATVGRLQRAIADLKAGSAMPGDPTPVPPIEAANRLGAVAGECVERLRALADAARRATVAGTGCEAQYDTLTHEVK